MTAKTADAIVGTHVLFNRKLNTCLAPTSRFEHRSPCAAVEKEHNMSSGQVGRRGWIKCSGVTCRHDRDKKVALINVAMTAGTADVQTQFVSGKSPDSKDQSKCWCLL
jgi:hypothetical protein